VTYRGVRSAVWFGFEAKSHLNRKIINYAVWFVSVDFKNKNRTNPMRFGLDQLVRVF